MPSRPERRSQRDGRGWQVTIIAIAAAYSPFTVLANAGEAPVLPTLVMAFLLILAISLAMWVVLRRFGLDDLGAAYAVALVVLPLTNVGSFVGDYHRLDRLGLVLLALLVASIGYRLRDMGAFRALMTWFILALLVYPVLTVVSRSGITGDIRVDVATDTDLETMESKPDILMVFFDGYGSAPVLDEFYGFDNSQVMDRLQILEFETPGGITANYARTQLSIPSVLQLGYVTEGGAISEADIDALQQVANGESRLVRALKSQGYRHVYVESGWLGSQCGPSVDVCIEAPWPDETLFDVVYRSILRGMPGFELGRSFTEGALQSASWLREELPAHLSDDTPDFVFAHVLLPHPPLFVDEHCSPDWRSGFPGFAIGRYDFDEQQRQAALDGYVEQVKCTNQIMLEIASLLGADDAAVMMGDHGPDSLGQLFVQGTEWSEAQRRERYGTFFAARIPGCAMGGIESLVNVGRRILGCLASTDLPDLPTRVYDMHKAPGGSTVHELEIPPASAWRTDVRS